MHYISTRRRGASNQCWPQIVRIRLDRTCLALWHRHTRDAFHDCSVPIGDVCKTAELSPTNFLWQQCSRDKGEATQASLPKAEFATTMRPIASMRTRASIVCVHNEKRAFVPTSLL